MGLATAPKLNRPRARANPLVRAPRRFAAVAGALAVVTLVCLVDPGCQQTDWRQAVRAGPAIGPDGAFRDFEHALRQHDVAAVGAILARANFYYRTPGERLGPARAAFGRLLVERLEPLFRDALVLTGEPEVEPFYDALGNLRGGDALLQIDVFPIAAIGRPIDVSRVLTSHWVMEDYAWRLSALTLDGVPLLPPDAAVRPDGFAETAGAR